MKTEEQFFRVVWVLLGLSMPLQELEESLHPMETVSEHTGTYLRMILETSGIYAEAGQRLEEPDETAAVRLVLALPEEPWKLDLVVREDGYYRLTAYGETAKGAQRILRQVWGGIGWEPTSNQLAGIVDQRNGAIRQAAREKAKSKKRK